MKSYCNCVNGELLNPLLKLPFGEFQPANSPIVARAQRQITPERVQPRVEQNHNLPPQTLHSAPLDSSTSKYDIFFQRLCIIYLRDRLCHKLHNKCLSNCLRRYRLLLPTTCKVLHPLYVLAKMCNGLRDVEVD